MEIEKYLDIAQYGIQTAMMVSAPVLLSGLVAGVAVSIFQAATQINDAALAFIPKIGATVLSLIVFGNWMGSKLTTFAIYAFTAIADVHP
jgi:flagellar biosynthetic protein FliQ